ncbi:MAG: cellulase family glycosylhydrolase [Lachnospiraceae bacterium]|nr:cellulase family glycosylhydrolase [Lachnospiraceae bacterium]
MLKEMGFYKGINFGGWLSQCDYSNDRLDHFIEEKDFETVASWGMDHVRIPIDYNVLENEDDSYKAEGFARIDCAVKCARKNGLNVVLDLHKTAGYSFDEGEGEGGFFDDEKLQERFYLLWEEIAKHYHSDHKHIAFELLNEVTSRDFIDKWNRISNTCIARIRKIAKDSLILVGSYDNNGVEAVKDLDKPYDDKIIFNFHCYDPLEFTHQGAYWTDRIDRNKRIPFSESGVTEAYFEKLFSSAIEKAEECGTELYCGEYGVIDVVSPEDALKWYSAIHSVFEKHQIAHAAWSYKEMDFGLSDARMDAVRKDLVKVL